MTVTELPSTAANADTAAYLVEITNRGPSNISKLFLAAETPDGAHLVGALPSAGACDTAGDLSCDLGQLRRGRSASVIVGYLTPAEGDELSVDFRVTTSGASGSDTKGRSHGDALNETGTTELRGDATTFAGRFIFTADQLVVATDQDTGPSNPHATKVVAPTTLIPVTVEDDTSESGCEEEHETCFGQTSEIHVDNGATFPEGFLVTIVFGTDELPEAPSSEATFSTAGYHTETYPPEVDTLTADQLNLWHQFDDLSGEDIPRCDEQEAFDEGELDPEVDVPASIPCFIATDTEDGITAWVWLTENGRIQGW
ncbi:MAG TPA: hypothetical protein VFH63_07700 [candidate division Zixibacteria bacterium]|nr:hypothetical protein [candidate division Zixibacteria bacterium]